MEIITADEWITGNYHRGQWFVLAVRKVPGGIKQLIQWYSHFDRTVIASDVIQHGTFSSRPYTVGQGCDGTVDACVHALFADFCVKRNLDPIALYRQAYQEHDSKRYSDPDYEVIKREADWQGVSYPTRWNKNIVSRLYDSLHAINNHMLASALSLAIERIPS